MVDIEAAIGYVVARGDEVDRARVGWLVSHRPPLPDALAKVAMGQLPTGGWPAVRHSEVASLDATCFRLSELDDLGALDGPGARRALQWLAGGQKPDGTWEEHRSLAATAPPWALPGDPEARLYLTASVGFWLAVGDGTPPAWSEVVARAAGAFRSVLGRDGRWPSFLMTGWFAAGLLFRTGWYYESAQVRAVLADRLPTLSTMDVAALVAVLRRAGVPDDDRLVAAGRKRLIDEQDRDGGWRSGDDPSFDVHTTVTAIRALV